MQEEPGAYNPPLTRWGHVWRTSLCVAISGLVWGEVAQHQLDQHVGLFVLDLVFGLASFVLMFYRRRSPFGIAMLLTLFGLVSMSAAGPGALALVSMATRRRTAQIVSVAVVSVVAGLVFAAYQPDPQSDPHWIDYALIVLVTAAMCIFGMYVGSRRELIWTLRERARQAESEQELRVDQARSSERERIAREMHDVLAHRISLVTMHAGALAYRTDLPAEQVRETAELIQTKAHEALSDLRQVLGVLRGTERDDRPQPTLSDLGELVEEATTSGMRVDFVDTTGPDVPAEQVGRTVYRIVQEALTNARKHAAGAHVAVRVAGSAEEGVSVSVSNARRVGASEASGAPGSGLGLVGLRERAELSGGSLAVVQDSTSFTLRGWLPWSPVVQT